jgi:hypothetical protein
MANGKVDRRQIPFGRTAPARAGLRQIRPVPLRRAHQGAGETGINQLNLSERLSASAGFKELPLGAHRSVVAKPGSPSIVPQDAGHDMYIILDTGRLWGLGRPRLGRDRGYFTARR